MMTELARKNRSYRRFDETSPITLSQLQEWTANARDWDGPEDGERPTAYVVVLHDTEVQVKPEFVWCDMGLACQNILLSASEEGYGGCIVASVDRDELRARLSIDSRYEPLAVVALGAPVETVRIVDIPADGSIEYYRDNAGTHYVPKRSMDELVPAAHG